MVATIYLVVLIYFLRFIKKRKIYQYLVKRMEFAFYKGDYNKK